MKRENKEDVYLFVCLFEDSQEVFVWQSTNLRHEGVYLNLLFLQ